MTSRPIQIQSCWASAHFLHLFLLFAGCWYQKSLSFFATFHVGVGVKRRVSVAPKQLELRPQIDARRDWIDFQTLNVDRSLEKYYQY